ncbi:MAG: hypothetical protein LBU51_01655 [Bacteroidales bacterium]|jgi:hypothetical protein|nr:hypothetical protein [Bacteroidales bacterium]
MKKITFLIIALFAMIISSVQVLDAATKAQLKAMKEEAAHPENTFEHSRLK